MKFFGREDDLKKVSNILCMPYKEQSVWFEVKGESGCGKTSLIKEAVNKAIDNSNSFYCVYLDIVADEYASNNFFKDIIQRVYIPINYHYDNVTVIPSKLSLSDFIKKLNLRDDSTKVIMGITGAMIPTIPLLGNLLALPLEGVKELVNNQLVPGNLLVSYLEFIAKKYRINIIIDNYQFLSPLIRQQFEASLNKINVGISIISIVRTIKYECSLENYCEDYKKETLLLEYASEKECKLLLRAQRNEHVKLSEEEINKIWMVTKGNLKNLELILNEIRVNPGYNIISAQNMIMNLDDVQKIILWIAALFPAGMREHYVISAIQNIINEDDSDKIKEQVTTLIQLGYIYLNSASNDAIKPTHETVIHSIKNTMNENDNEYIRNALVHSLENIIQSNGKTADYAYLIHCWIGISTMDNLCNNIIIIEELISIKFKENAYYYIDDIAIKIKEILFYFDDIILKKIMIAFQRISDFQNGLTLLHNLKIKNVSAYQKLKIFYAKFLIQTYNFEDALEVLNEMEVSTETILCRLNALQHLGMDKKAEDLLKSEIHHCEKTEDYYIILRNASHYFPYEDAVKNLEYALDFFDNKQFSEFTIATIKNNLGVVTLWQKEYRLAKDYLKQAEIILDRLQSNEIFEPLCNLSICALLTNDNNNAITYIQKSLEHCPRTLHLDILMLQINKTVIQISRGDIHLTTAVDFLQCLIDKNKYIEDPWYKFHLHFNFSQLSNLLGQSRIDYSSIYLDNYYDGLTKFYVLESFIINDNKIKLCLGLSPNWRY